MAQKHHNYGLGYIKVLSITLVILDIFVAGLISLLVVSEFFEKDAAYYMTYLVFLFIFLVVLFFCCSQVMVKLFENIAILAKNSTDMKDKMMRMQNAKPAARKKATTKSK